MNPNAVIESYVDDVVRRLPRWQRRDVGFELRSLLGEELGAKAAEAGRPADEAMALALLHGFGPPETVAARYRPNDFTIIPPSQTRPVAFWALGSVAAQWAVTLPAVFVPPEAFPGQHFARLGGWWTTWGLGAFWAPGLMLVIAIVAAWIRHRWPRTNAWTPRRVLDHDSINRPLMALALVAWAAGAAVWIGMPWYGPHLPGALPRVFAFDAGFLHTRAPWLLPVWLGQYLVYVAALAAGRWRPLTRRANLAFGAALCGVLVWFAAAGPIFRAAPTDEAARLSLALIVLVSLISVGVSVIREQGRIGPPRGLTNAPGA
jgi:hypothetical protein